MNGTYKIIISETLLSDGSPVFAVSIWGDVGDGEGVIFDAINYQHALSFANAIKLASEADTLSIIEIVDRSFIGPRPTQAA